MKKTKIVCTVGPASNEMGTLEKMMKMGMNAVRINFSHSVRTEMEKTIKMVREINKKNNANLAILFDTKGPDLRTGKVEGGQIFLEEGKTIRVVKNEIVGTKEAICFNQRGILDLINENDIIYIEDGLIKLVVVDDDNEGITCQIMAGGMLGNKKSVNIPGVKMNMPFISEDDQKDIVYACQNGADYLALSFVSSRADVEAVREILDEQKCSSIQIVSKIECAKALENLDEIIDASDGIMVARGDLGVEVPIEQLPIWQKEIIAKCIRKEKVCIVATEMLSSMQYSNRPTRAEVSDIANAVLDGTDAVMLSGESAIGKHPVEAVKCMAEICENAENYYDYQKRSPLKKENITSAIAHSVVESVNWLDVKLIVAATISGYTARKISILRPKCPILATSYKEKTLLSLALNYGVYCQLVERLDTATEIIEDSVAEGKKFMPLVDGDKIVLTGGLSNCRKERRDTNFMKIEEI